MAAVQACPVSAGALTAAPVALLGGYRAAGWTSVLLTLLAVPTALGLARRGRAPVSFAGTGALAASWAALLRAGLSEARTTPWVRSAVALAAVVTGLGVVDEYLPLLALEAGTPPPLSRCSCCSCCSPGPPWRPAAWPEDDWPGRATALRLVGTRLRPGRRDGRAGGAARRPVLPAHAPGPPRRADPSPGRLDMAARPGAVRASHRYPPSPTRPVPSRGRRRRSTLMKESDI
ncbi:hypothetical protein GCM10010254_64330 [Streptomyces chromofuscus]|nr:hypothetical protein GCM10010254_64330 [Streptomyces chromofuscus]